MESGRERKPRPIAVVALGDPAMGDDGVALRVMGRVRPLLAEIALTGEGKTALGRRCSAGGSSSNGGPPAWIQAAALAAKQPSTSRAAVSRRSPALRPNSLVSLVDWIEGCASPDLLAPVLENRRRVVLIDAVMHGASPGGVQHWHLERLGATDLHLVRFYRPMAEDSLDHLPFWIEDDLPEHGTDLIAIEPYRIEPDHELSPVIRSRLASITSQVGGLLLRILEEEGWRVPRSGQRRARKGDGKAA